MSKNTGLLSTLFSMVFLFCLCMTVGLADVRLPAIFSDHMVLQQGTKVAVWGWADPGENISVTLGKATARAKADASGRWKVELPAQKPGPGNELEVRGNNSIRVRDVLVGEVWLCSGQSNMEFALQSTTSGAQDVAAANHPDIRLFRVPKNSVLSPAEDVQAKWEVCTPESAAGFSAVGYYFGLELHKRLKVPVGLIGTSWGGTNAEEWTSPEFLANDADFAAIHQRWEKSSDENKRLFREPLEHEIWLDDFQLLPRSEKDTVRLVDDFEDGNLENRLGGRWSSGQSSIDIADVIGGAGKALRIKGSLKAGDFPNLQVEWAPGQAAADLRTYKALSFKVRGRGFLKFHSLQPTITDFDHYVDSPFAVTGGWRTVTVDLTGLKQAGWGVQLPFTPDALTGALLEIVPGIEPMVRPPSGLYNGMIAPMVPYSLRGFAWYQGEGNAGRSYQYRKLLPALIRSWRSAWHTDNLPFLVVQLPNYRARLAQPSESGWAELREAQLLTARNLPGVGVAVTIDQGRAENVHPPDKTEVGRRLALQAFSMVYGLPGVASGPLFKSWKKDGSAIRVRFSSAGGGLVPKGGEPLRGFAIAGEDRKFVWAEARIEGDEVVVSSAQVAAPMAVRYAWADNPEATLYNREGLPASPFRTDEWPGQTIGAR